MTPKFKVGDVITFIGGSKERFMVSEVQPKYRGYLLSRLNPTNELVSFFVTEQYLLDYGHVLKTGGKAPNILDYGMEGLDSLRIEFNPPDHSTHEVVTNDTLGKTFKYCRDCKKEVL